MAEKSKTILIVDDERKVAETLRMIVEGVGYQVIVAHSGEEAARVIREAAPDAVVLDVILPGKDGIEVAIEAYRSAPNCKVLLFSGRPDTADLLTRARDQGFAFDIMAKPTRPQELLKKIAELLSP